MTSPASYQQRPKLPTEFALMVACCRWTWSTEGADEVRGLAGAVDWGAFLRACRRHRVQGLAWHALTGLNVALPAPVQVALGGDARAIAEHGLRAAKESARLASAFFAAGLRLLFLKGLTLGRLAYSNPFLKMGWDIDLLVEPADLASAASILGQLNYKLDTPRDTSLLLRWHGSRKESIWRGRHHLFVELHSRVADQPELLPTINASSPSRQVKVAAGIDLPTLADEGLFAYLCVHGASSAWFRLKWITDLAALLHGRSASEIERLHDRAQELGAGRAAAQALLIAERLYEIPLPSALANRLRSTVNRWLARAALRGMLRGEPTERPFGTLTIHLTQFFLKDGVRYKVAELGRQARAAAGFF
jgi:hypothetical protein